MHELPWFPGYPGVLFQTPPKTKVQIGAAILAGATTVVTRQLVLDEMMLVESFQDPMYDDIRAKILQLVNEGFFPEG